ncbi:metal ABC transporter solute-binding protein, Zn/Mn family [Listeria booriae]|uniref:Zinc ABC transporter solute-binding protein n=1 Tax=Listeria booriae TaxID=1552123 RepID=A0A7X0XM02_9LIST|nr:zinc ABC transporter substrate-binding protein [Listeria booriae]MBC1402094.1 zinc ABC transporter solute-binding protein [Listeria booriae]MBC1558281.1 zinc ABC transporter solute-binding protein [Listeria booriae]MBC1563213.1 zinc ABC transporter solute-binding protein [Listeria booriae]MBC1566590.1 zinc ABC transporter solute-binding protein [Listeria booriae]MBC1573369.1 zinc ABC transporter solute-binding protein [Listeria booriae]
MKKLAFLLSTLLVAAVFLAGCGDNSDAQKKDNDKLTVYTTVYPLQYLASQIGGTYVDAHSVYPAGSDAHSFDPTQKDMMNIADSDLFFYIGLGMEGFVDKAKQSLKNENVKFVVTTDNLHLPTMSHEEEDHEHEEDEDGHDHGDINPHVWLDPNYMITMAATVRDNLSKELPAQKETFNKNYEKVVSQLKTLNTDYKTMADTAKHKDFVTAHAAYGYWEKEYGLKQIPIAGISTSDEPSQKKLTTIVNTIKSEKIPYILLEQNTNSKIADVIQKETDTKTLKLHNLETLTQKDIDAKRDYMSIMKDNLAALKTALNY